VVAPIRSQRACTQFLTNGSQSPKDLKTSRSSGEGSVITSKVAFFT